MTLFTILKVIWMTTLCTSWACLDAEYEIKLGLPQTLGPGDMLYKVNIIFYVNIYNTLLIYSSEHGITDMSIGNVIIMRWNIPLSWI